MHPSELTSLAILAAQRAGEILKRGFGTEFAIEFKEGKRNLVTAFDKASEEAIITAIAARFPSHAILAEESGSSRGHQSDVTWIIDPLDGTVNFAHHIPLFSISIGVAIGQEIVSGVILQPMTGELFVAEKSQGAYLNGQKLSVTLNKGLEEALLATGFPYDVDQNPLHCIDRFATLQAQGIPIRRLGSAAIDLAYVAAGRFDAYWEVSLHPWDMAAGKLLVEEAGGQVSLWNGAAHPIFKRETILATNRHLHPSMVQFLTSDIQWRSS